MTRTTVPPTRPENPGGETPIEDPRRNQVDKDAPSKPDTQHPVKAPADPDRKRDRRDDPRVS